jgi:hypothetical protein
MFSERELIVTHLREAIEAIERLASKKRTQRIMSPASVSCTRPYSCPISWYHTAGEEWMRQWEISERKAFARSSADILQDLPKGLS